MASTTRFPIKFEPAYALVSRALLLLPGHSYVEIGSASVSVRMGWGFRSTFERSVVQRVAPFGRTIPLTRGVHGWAGRWLVNGAGDGIVVIHLEPRQRAYVMGFPVKLRELLVSVDEPAALASALRSV